LTASNHRSRFKQSSPLSCVDLATSSDLHELAVINALMLALSQEG
jgi:hypothetical protein